MKVKKRTPRSDMYYEAIVGKMAEFYEGLAQELGLPASSVDRQMTVFAILATRIEVDGDQLDFEFPLPIDSPEDIKAKFLRYLDTEQMAWVDAALDAKNAYDRPKVETALTPVAPPDAEKN